MIQFMSITQGITIHLTIILIRIRCLLSLGPPSTNILTWENQFRILTTAITRQEAARSIPDITIAATTTQPCITREVEALRAGMLAEEAEVYRMILVVEMVIIFRKISDIEKENKNSFKFSMILVRKSQTILMNFVY